MDRYKTVFGRKYYRKKCGMHFPNKPEINTKVCFHFYFEKINKETNKHKIDTFFSFDPNSHQILFNILWDHKRYTVVFLLTRSGRVDSTGFPLSRGRREGERWGNHFGVYGSCSHVPLAHAYPLHPQAKEGKTLCYFFFIRKHMRLSAKMCEVQVS